MGRDTKTRRMELTTVQFVGIVIGLIAAIPALYQGNKDMRQYVRDMRKAQERIIFGKRIR